MREKEREGIATWAYLGPPRNMLAIKALFSCWERKGEE